MAMFSIPSYFWETASFWNLFQTRTIHELHVTNVNFTAKSDVSFRYEINVEFPLQEEKISSRSEKTNLTF